jgi:F-type H+-transporting ATPase subunit b
MEEILNSLPEPMQVNSTVLIVAALFLVLIFVLNKLVFKPLTAIMEDRETRIQEGVEARAKSLATVEEREAAYREAVVKARKEAQSKRQNLSKESELAREEILTSSREQAMAMIQAAATEIDKQVDKAKTGLEQETKAIAKDIVSSVLSRATA